MAQGTAVLAVAESRGEAGNTAGDFSRPNKPLATREMQQYEEILRFRNQVGSGLHPRIKPTHLLGKPVPSSANGLASGRPATTTNKGHENGPNGTRSPRARQNNAAGALAGAATVPGLGRLPGASAGPSKPVNSGEPEIDTVLLAKSDHLKRAELRLRRQALERSLEEQLEQSRHVRASLQTTEQLAGFDVAGVLDQALSVVRDSLAQPTDNAAANAEASSDSFDDNTFYSSQDTPSSRVRSRRENESEDEEMQEGSPYEPELDPQPAAPTVAQVQPPTAPASTVPQNVFFQHAVGTSTPGSGVALTRPTNSTVPGISTEATNSNRPFHHLPPGISSSRTSGSGSRSEESGTTGIEGTSDSRDLSRVNERLISQGIGHRDSPLVRAHDLSPVAPQPAHVSPLAVARQQPLARVESDVRRGTPAQVAALRNQHSAATTPDSSPQTSRAAERRKKKKKRKSDRFGQEAAAVSPYIKPEPRSPSPLTAPSYARPPKRQRQSNHTAEEYGYEEIRYERPRGVNDEYQERYQPSIRREERVVGYERIDETGRREVEPVRVDSQGFERVYVDGSRPAGSLRHTVPEHSHVFETQYGPREIRTVRPVSRVLDEGLAETVYFPDAQPGGSRTSIRPPMYRTRSQSPITYERHPSSMPPPRAVPTRIVVDAFGRELYEQSRPSISNAPPYAGGQIYQAPPPRAVSRRPDEENGMLYRPASPTYHISRRVATQPDFLASDRVYREGSQARLLPAGEYIPSRTRLESRAIVDPAHEYVSRAASTRPPYENLSGYGPRPGDERSGIPARYELPVVTYERRVGDEVVRAGDLGSLRSASVRPAEPIRYEPARDYGHRIGSVRPEVQIRDYAASGHPDARRDVMQPPPAVGRGYSVVPNDHSVQVMPHGPAPAYYGRQPIQGDDDIVLLDRAPRNFYQESR